MKPLMLSAIVLSLCLVVSCDGRPEPVAVAESTVTSTSTLLPPTDTPPPPEPTATATNTPELTATLSPEPPMPEPTPTPTPPPTDTPTPLPTDTPTPVPPTDTPTPVPPTDTPTPEPTPTLSAEEQIRPGYTNATTELEIWWGRLIIRPGVPDESRVNLALTRNAAFLDDDLGKDLETYCRILDVLPEEDRFRGWIASNKYKSKTIGLHPQYLANAEAFSAMQLRNNETLLTDYVACMFVKEARQVKYKVTTGDEDINRVETAGWSALKRAAEGLAEARDQMGQGDVSSSLRQLAHQAQIRIERQEWYKSWGTF